MTTRACDRGFVATELVAAVALLLLPTFVLVATLPRWSELRHAAIVAAREAAATQADAWPDDATRTASDVARVVVASYGADPARTAVVVRTDHRRGGEIVARVTVTLPAFSVAGVAAVGEWHWTAEARRRVDDYRSR